MKKMIYIFAIASLFCLASCEKEVVPVLQPIVVEEVTADAVACSCEVMEGSIEQCGFYYATSKNNVTNKKGKKADATFSGSTISGKIVDLEPNTTYYIMGYGMNEKGEGVTEVVQVKTTSLVPDIDDNQYPGKTE